jgi:hypothetical protein
MKFWHVVGGLCAALGVLVVAGLHRPARASGEAGTDSIDAVCTYGCRDIKMENVPPNQFSVWVAFDLDQGQFLWKLGPIDGSAWRGTGAQNHKTYVGSGVQYCGIYGNPNSDYYDADVWGSTVFRFPLTQLECWTP